MQNSHVTSTTQISHIKVIHVTSSSLAIPWLLSYIQDVWPIKGAPQDFLLSYHIKQRGLETKLTYPKTLEQRQKITLPKHLVAYRQWAHNACITCPLLYFPFPMETNVWSMHYQHNTINNAMQYLVICILNLYNYANLININHCLYDAWTCQIL